MFNRSNWNLIWVFDYVSLRILLMLFVCFVLALFYTPHYFSGDVAGVELSKIICGFVLVMASLVSTGDFISTLVFWEYLGVVSYFLILFYANYLRLRSSIITLVSSRFGDVSLFLMVAICLMVGNYKICLCSILLYFIIFTKSAGFPLISWLLEAMRAPTPVSSLVHSSTLVAAGVWFAIRYDIFYFYPKEWYFSLFLIVTVFIRGICCFWFLDLKKIIALSTCNNISWCVLYLFFGDVSLSLFQLITHGVSKCTLFMLIGDIMRGSGGSQARNCVFTSRFYGKLNIFSLFSVVLGLSGAPFIGVFFTKHFFLSTFRSINKPIFCFCVLSCVFISYFYSFRLCVLLLKTKSSISTGVIFSFRSGLLVYVWLFVNFFLGRFLSETYYVTSNISYTLLVFQLMSCFTAYYLYNNNWLSHWSSSLFGCDSLVEKRYFCFNTMRLSLGLFFFRWDYQIISLSHGHGINLFKFFNNNLLNMIMARFIIYIFFICVTI